MLLQLKIRDLAIIDEVELDLPPGFIVVTGETGAGKSLLIDALVVALGGRATSELVRAGAGTAEVEALFDIAQQPLIKQRLAERDLVGDDADVLLVRRVVGQKGKAKVVINGRLSTLATLVEIVRGLADISGQHEQLSLLDVDRHLDILDAFADLGERKRVFAAAYARLRELYAERAAFEKSMSESAKRADFLRFQIDEIDHVGPQLGEDRALSSELLRLGHAEKLKQGAALADGMLYGDDGAAFEKVGKAIVDLGALARIDGELEVTLPILTRARADIEEVARLLQRYGDHIEADPNRLEAVEERLASLQRLCRKHGGGLDEVLAKREALAQELDGIEHRDSRIADIVAQSEALAAEVLRLAQELSKARRAAAARLDKAVLAEAADMELADAVFVTEVRPLPAGQGVSVGGLMMGPSGSDQVEFLWSANPGEPPRALAKIASGGELSRLMLAVKRVLSSRDLVSLYVFDEVDTGLGGKAADAIGRKLRAVARGHQAVAVTHLAAIASLADHHLRAEKASENGRTVSRIVKVSGREREVEIARMIDGVHINATTLEAARAMLARASTIGPAL